jgi:hypothetical protein
MTPITAGRPEIILADPKRFAGLPLAWAKLWVERHRPEIPPRLMVVPTPQQLIPEISVQKVQKRVCGGEEP